MSFNVGLNVIEVESQAPPSIQAAPTSVAAFVIRGRKGVPGRAYRITNWTQFEDRFGSFMPGAFGAYAMRGFIDNGGTVAYITRVVRAAGGTAAVTAGRSFDDGGSSALSVFAGTRAEENPGEWGNDLAIRIADHPTVVGAYDLFVRLNGEDVETWTELNNDTDPAAEGRHPETVLNDELTGSNYIVVTEDATNNPAATDGTADADADGFVLLADGEDGGEPTVGEYNNALDAFDVHDVQLVCCPETDDVAWVTEALTYCESRGDCMLIGHTPLNNDVAAATAYGQGFQGSKRSGALYFPWIQVSDPEGAPLWAPPTGHILGVYARTERERGIWKAPAGNAARVNGALDVREHITDADHTDLVKSGSVNAVRFIPGVGIVLDSSRSLSTDTRWLYINVRLLMNFVKTSLKYGLRWVVQEPNDQTLWNKVKFNSVTPFLMGLWRRGAFGSGAPEDVFTVQIDSENNSPEDIEQGILNIKVSFYPSRPAETIVIRVSQQESGATASEA